MNKKEIKTKATELLSSGVGRSEVFSQLAGGGLKDAQLAYHVAAYPDTGCIVEHGRKVNLLITLMFIQALFVFFVGFGIGAKIGPNAKWIMGGLLAAIPLLFAWGFYSYKVGVFNAYILLSIVQIPQSFKGFTDAPIASSIGIAISLAMLGAVWYVRDKLFPDFAFIGPKKVKGQYVFST